MPSFFFSHVSWGREGVLRWLSRPVTAEHWWLFLHLLSNFGAQCPALAEGCIAQGQKFPLCNEKVWHNGMRNQQSWPLPTRTAPPGCPSRAAEGGRKGEGPLEVSEVDVNSWDVVLETMGYLMHRTRVHVSFAAAQLPSCQRLELSLPP